MKVSVVIPAYNEEPTLPLLRERLSQVIDALGEYEFEIVLVDDHSADATPELIDAWARADRRVRGLRFARNCGSHAALTAGLAHCTGDCAVLMAADLQDPPELLHELLARWRAGHDVVWAARSTGFGESRRTRLLAWLYWTVMRRFTTVQAPDRGTDVVLLDRKVIDALAAVGEKNTSLILLLTWMGFRQTRISYVKAERAAGQTGWTFSKRLKIAIDSLVSFSSLPICLTWACGLLFLLAAGIWGVSVLAGRLLGVWHVAALPAAMMGVLLLGFGLLLTFLGAIGEYVWRAYDQARGRPRYVIERTMGHQESCFVPESQAATPPAAPVEPARPEPVEAHTEVDS